MHHVQLLAPLKNNLCDVPQPAGTAEVQFCCSYWHLQVRIPGAHPSLIRKQSKQMQFVYAPCKCTGAKLDFALADVSIFALVRFREFVAVFSGGPILERCTCPFSECIAHVQLPDANE